MENFKGIIKISVIVVLTGFFTACGDDDNNGGNKTQSGVLSVTTYECDSPNEQSQLSIELKEHGDFADELVSLKVKAPGMTMEMNLLLGLRVRSQYEIRQALYFKDGQDTGHLKDLAVVRDPYEAPEVLVLDTFEGWVEVRSRALRRVLRTGLAPDYERDYEYDDRRQQPPERRDSSDRPPRPERNSSLIYTCKKR